ncbi:hypothetical protein B0F90DRAFT_1670558 [Multifurca ochricompacta]|uniref:VWFA domain-containing protein n=1 Tax=Multifurca ochricompacta TaxID=376703 RepID=A0AAD4LZP7_9AGAM|nr:hypothetical protein B0F90DRAFT_1670558 [Multifurca ochricompacta]
MATCNGGAFTISALQPGHSYKGPSDIDDGNLCKCNTITYSLISACDACQGETWTHWSEYSFNCTKVMPPSARVIIFPNAVPSGTRVPQWALLDITHENSWNASTSFAVGDTPEIPPGAILSPSGSSISSQSISSSISSPRISPTSTIIVVSTLTPTSSGSKSNTGAIAGGIVGGIATIAIAGLAVFFWQRRRKPLAPSSAFAEDGTSAVRLHSSYYQAPPPMGEFRSLMSDDGAFVTPGTPLINSSSMGVNPGPPDNPAVSDFHQIFIDPGWSIDEKPSNAQIRKSNVPLAAQNVSDRLSGPVKADGKSAQKSPDSPPPMDLAEAVKGMYRLLDLISELGGNGSVDKAIVAQDTLKCFINTKCHGAYASITKVDFKALDRLMIKPLGVYGSKEEIVRFLLSIGAVNEEIARFLLVPTEAGGSRPTLSSGLYIVMAQPADTSDERHYVIYWPEDSTWNDSATSSILHNRVMFMRYLTKMCDQVVALLSAEHAASINWKDEDNDTDTALVEEDVGNSNRLFALKVAKTNNEQEQGALSRPGFQMNSRHILPYEAPSDCSVDPSVFVPRLLHGETTQGFWTATFISRQIQTEHLYQRLYQQLSLKHLLLYRNTNALVLSEDLSEDAVQVLVDLAISDIFPERCNEWRELKEKVRDGYNQKLMRRQDEVCLDLSRGEHSLQHALRAAVVDEVIKLFPFMERDSLNPVVQAERHSEVTENVTGRKCRSSYSFSLHSFSDLKTIRQLYPSFSDIYRQHVESAKFANVKGPDFKLAKKRLTAVLHLLEKHPHLANNRRIELIEALLSGVPHHAHELLPKSDKKEQNMITKALKIIFPQLRRREEEEWKKEMKDEDKSVTDSDFLLKLTGIPDKDLQPAIQEARILAQTQLSSSIDREVKKMFHAVLNMQQDHCKQQVRHEIQGEENKALGGVLLEFIQGINTMFSGRNRSVMHIDRVEVSGSVNYSRVCTKVLNPSGQEYKITGRREAPEEPKLEFLVHPMNLSSEDKHFMQSDPKYIPNPTVNDRRSFSQLLEKEKLLLILAHRDKFAVYLERLVDMDGAIGRGKLIKPLNCDKLGHDVLFAFDEARRMLVVTLQSQGSAIDMAPWYSEGEISIQKMCFVYGNDEVALLDSSVHVRIFSFVTLQFRPASLQLPSLPSAIYSSPDGSFLLTIQSHDSETSFTAYHWETFGSTSGISMEVPKFPLGGAVLTSMVERGRVFFTGLDIEEHCVKSIAIDITRRDTEFVFKEKGRRNGSKNGSRRSLHNSLLDCHGEVWTRFPVLAAVRRRTITSSSHRRQNSLTFVTENHTQPFRSYFLDLIRVFEKTTQKPTGDELRRVEISAANFDVLREKVILDSDWNVSQYRVGEWLVDLLCLIPVQIAVCRENRFVPMANGVLSAELERSLLGAEVSKVVDKLSFGWYESIFQSYMALKPVKVVSSMGQQSVGKSYALNHLVDTSFAGNAMGTTGVNSIERSPQEDALLVLFNTAISNLVLFHNNFAFSRDISGLFQSFQSSASVFDPAANPSLFQSTLVIIIEASIDVVEPDKDEITHEFSLKFQKIVQQEQDANFISRLHGGKLDIIPWPVIESKDFYNLFATLKKRLDQQDVSHPAAGEFLHTTKTLMAKLKLTLLTETMAEHRTKSLSAHLATALATGFSEVEPGLEPLKNLDTDLIVEGDDTTACFAIAEREPIPPAELEVRLIALLESWSPSTQRQFMPDSEWINKLSSNISEIIDMRANHVKLWLDCNLESSAALNARCAISSVSGVGFMKVDTAAKLVTSVRINVDSVKMISVVHQNQVLDTLGSTLYSCVVNAHLCGETCHLFGKRGCLEECTKVMGHAEDEHLCSAPVHMCGEDKYGEQRRAHMPSFVLDLGICQIDTAPQSIQATFTGRLETFQYTKVRSIVSRGAVLTPKLVARQLQAKRHTTAHTLIAQKSRHLTTAEPVVLAINGDRGTSEGHPQPDHDTSHGSMTQTRWAVDGPDGTSLELGGRKFSSNDEGAPMMCNLVCSSLDRHVHIDYCRAGEDGRCDDADIQHLGVGMIPHPDKPKDFITHGLHWRRSDPYTRDEQTNFAKCDFMCSGPEHSAAPAGSGQPSYCTLPIFHPPMDPNSLVNGFGYISYDGHRFECNNPVVMRQAFHVIFVIDRSGSMSLDDRRPLSNAPATNLIQWYSNNRLGAVYSALYSFWTARHVAVTPGQQTSGARRDAYSIIFFDAAASCVLFNDFTSSPDQLLSVVLTHQADGGTNYSEALRFYSKIRAPVMIFLSDGECSVHDESIQNLCRSAIQLGKPLSFHAVSFGPDTSSTYLRRMAQLALEIQNNAPRDLLTPATAQVPSSFTVALDTVRLAETFLVIAESLRKPRGSLMR